MSKKKGNTRWNVPVPRTLDDALEEAVRLDTHSTKSDFVRDAVRRKLEEMGFKPQPFLEAPSQ
jgi:Arc/MetJ-type ribon-helix-helix transcriptional regulator